MNDDPKHPTPTEVQPDPPTPIMRLVKPARPEPAEAEATFRSMFGDFPAPTADMDAVEAENVEVRTKAEAQRAAESTIDFEHGWARFGAPELAVRVANGEALLSARKALEDPMVVFIGAPGTGKTSLAVAMLRAWVATHARAGGFFHAILLGAAGIRHPAGHGEPDMVAQAKRLPCVVLDDIGSERDVASNDLPEILLVRHSKRLPTFVTTGFKSDQLVARYGGGIARRLTERSTIIRVGKPGGKGNP